jgi:hypothetical protein
MTDWDDPAKAQQVGAVLPPNVNVVQAAGGHANPVFYVSDGAALFRLDAASGQWVKIVPGGPPGQTANAARRFFVNPFDANTLYVLDDDGVKVSLDGGATWLLEISLTWAITAGGRLTLNPNTALLDMLFARSEPFTRFVFGHAGVACTVNGTDWRPLLSSLALPGRPESGFFDAFSDPFDRKLYVTLAGRSVLRLDPIPAPRLHPPPVFGMLELAAVLGEA